MTPEVSRSAQAIRFSMYPLMWAAIAFAFGIALAQLSGADWRVWLGSAFILGVAALALKDDRTGPYLALTAVSLAGALTYQFQISNVSEHRIKRIYDETRIESGTPVEIDGRLVGLPEPAYDGAFIRVEVSKLTAKKADQSASGIVRMFVPLVGDEQRLDLASLDLRSSTMIRTFCELLREDQYLNPGVMPRRQLLDQQVIDATCTVKSPLLIEVVDRPAWPSALDLVYEQRARLIEEFRARLSPQAAGVMIASLLGDKHFLDKDTADVFRDGGTFHVLVISGLHITFIGGLLYWLVGIFTRNSSAQFLIVCGILWLYTLAVGAEVPVVRASIMFTVLLLGRALYRHGTLLNTFGLSCLILLAWRPADLFTPSFQLTVASVASIIGLAFPLVEKLRSIGSWMPDATLPFPPNVPNWLRRFCETLYWRPIVWDIEKGRQIWRARIFKSPVATGSDGFRSLIAYIFEALLVSLVVQLWMLPLAVYYFHRVSPISVLLNLWVGIVIALESFVAVLAIVFGQISERLALPFALITEGSNWLLIELPRLFSDLGWASFRVPVYSGPGKAIYLLYFLPILVLAAIAFRWDPFALRRPGRVAILSMSAIALTAAVLAGLISFHPFSGPRADGTLKVEFLDVGQGDATFITFPNGETMLIDGGGRVDYSADQDDAETFEPDVPRIGEMVVSEFLWEKGYSHIDRLVVTHADADHSQGPADVARNFGVGEILIGSEPAAESEMAELLSLADRHSIPVRQIGRDDFIEIADVRIDVLWPILSAKSATSDNNSSLVLRIAHGANTFLFTGDIEKEAEAELVNNPGSLKADIVKVPHHGSRTSSTADFVAAVAPHFAIVPVGNRSLFGHPHPEVVERWRDVGAEVRTTGSKGTVTVVSKAESWSSTNFRP